MSFLPFMGAQDQPPVSASLSATLGALSCVAAVAVAVSAAAAPTLGDVTVSAQATAAVSASAAPILGALTVSVQGAVAVAASTGLTLGDLTLNASGAVGIAAVAAPTLDALMGAATGTVAVAGSLAATLDALTCESAASGAAVSPPAVTTFGLRAIPSPTTVLIDGNVTDDGGGTIVERGVCWSIAANPTIADHAVPVEGSTGAFRATLAGLSAATTYHVRAYAHNEAGTTYGADVTVVAGWATYLASSAVASSVAWSRAVAVTAGDLVVVSYHQVTAGAFTHNPPTDSQENAYTNGATLPNPAGSGRTSVFWARASADGTITVVGTTSAAGACVFAVHVFTGVDPFGPPVHAVQTGQGTSESPATSPVVAVAAGELLFAAATINDIGAGLAAGPGFTIREGYEGTFSTGTETVQIAAGATHAADFSGLGSGNWSIVGLSVKKAAPLPIQGTLAVTLAGVSLSAQAQVATSAVLAQTLGAVTASGTARTLPEISASAVLPLDALTGTGAGTVRPELFCADPDWTEPVTEQTQYLTNILSAYNGNEQRIALRTRPRTRVAFRIMPTGQVSAAAFDAFLDGWQSRTCGVPFWPDAQPVTQPLAAGESVIVCDTQHRKFAAGGLVMLWRDVFTHEVARILSVAADHLTTMAPVDYAWPSDGRTYAVPVLLGRWDGEASVGRLSPTAGEADAAFVCDSGADVAPAVLPQVYGYDVFELEPNAAQGRTHVYSRILQVFDGATGARMAIYDRAGVAVGQSKDFLWTLGTRAEIAAYRAWAALRKGRCAAFWLPTWQHDLVQAVAIGPGSNTVVVQRTGYSQHQWPNAARRYLCVAMLDGTGARHYRKVTAAVASDTTDVLTLDEAFGPTTAIPVGSCMISFLQLVRLSTDEPELTWYSRDVAEVTLDCVEVPFEVAP